MVNFIVTITIYFRVGPYRTGLPIRCYPFCSLEKTVAYQNVTPDKFYGRPVVFRPERCLDDKVNLNVNPCGVNSKKKFYQYTVRTILVITEISNCSIFMELTRSNFSLCVK